MPTFHVRSDGDDFIVEPDGMAPRLLRFQLNPEDVAGTLKPSGGLPEQIVADIERAGWAKPEYGFGAVVWQSLFDGTPSSKLGPGPIFLDLAPEAEWLPWEAAYDRQRWLALSHGVIRLGANPNQKPFWRAEDPLRVLVLSDDDPLLLAADFCARVRGTVEELGGSIQNAAVSDLASVDSALAEVVPTVVVVVAHGRDEGRSISIGGRTIDAADLAHRVAVHNPRLVIANVCDSAAPRTRQSFISSLLGQGVSAAIGARTEVSHDAIAQFTEGFLYSMAHRNADLAACMRGGLRHVDDQLHRSTLSLYSASADLSLTFGSAVPGAIQRRAQRRSGEQKLRSIPLYVPKRSGLHSEAGFSPSAVLRPEARIVPLVGREQELAGLAAWRDSVETIDLAIIAGSGGSGKTRLAIDFVEETITAGWTAGFLAVMRSTRPEETIASIVGEPDDTLVVLDYAETDPAFAAELLYKAIANRQSGALRVIMLVRQRPADNAWTESFTMAALGTHGTVQDLLERAAIFDLTANEIDSADLASAWLEALRPHVAEPHSDPALDRLSGATPLLIGAEALAALAPGEEVDKQSSAIKHLLGREARHWASALPQADVFGKATHDQAVAAAALSGASDLLRLAQVVGQLPIIKEFGQPLSFARGLQALMIEGQLLAPDLLLEAHVANVMREDTALATTLLDGATPNERARHLRIYSRILDDDPDHPLSNALAGRLTTTALDRVGGVLRWFATCPAAIVNAAADAPLFYALTHLCDQGIAPSNLVLAGSEGGIGRRRSVILQRASDAVRQVALPLSDEKSSTLQSDDVLLLPDGTTIDCSSAATLDPVFGLLARIAHAGYRSSVEYNPDKESHVDWHELPEVYRASNYAQVTDLLSLLDTAPLRVRELEPDEEVSDIDPGIREQLAQAEHLRWMRHVGQTQPEHKDLVPWDQLDAETKDKDRTAVDRLPLYLSILGLKIESLAD